MIIESIPTVISFQQGVTGPASTIAAGPSAANGFAQTLSSLAVDAVETLDRAEVTSVKALSGSAGPREVAEAVTEAERSLQIAVAVRDRIVSAFMEISRMAI